MNTGFYQRFRPHRAFAVLLVGAVALIATRAQADEASATVASIEIERTEFLAEHCIDCHSVDSPEGDLSLEGLAFDPSDESNRRRWVTIFDRVRAGEMPPDDGYFGEPEERDEFLKHLAGPIDASIAEEQRSQGRVRSRRLNRIEYENTVHDLLAIDVPLRELLPEDTFHHGFATVAAAQQVSHHLMQRYLDAADVALDEAFKCASEMTANRDVRHFTSEDLGRKPGQRDPWHVGNKTIAWSAAQLYHGRVPESECGQTGWYRITLHDAHAVNPPRNKGVWCTVRTGACYAREPLMFTAGIFRADATPKDRVFDAWFREGHLIEARPADDTIPRVPGKKLNSYKGSARDKRPMPTVPGLAYSAITIESLRPSDRRAVGTDAATRLFGSGKLESDASRKDIVHLMHSFATRAFRRPVAEEEMRPYLELVDADLAAGLDVRDVLRRGYRSILVSPRFLFFQESLGELDSHAVANRLSYFLWSTMPDDELLQAADAGELRESKSLHAQVERMLKHPRANGLVSALADQWLNLREIDFTSPDSRLYPEFDETLKESMIAETHQFLAKLIRDDLPVITLIDSDFVMLNERLAKHYGIPDVPHEAMTPVLVSGIHHRGGLLTQGALLKVTANGTSTSPVVRGAFVNERLLGVEIPPPPDNVPAIEPDIRGATSIRDQLKKHSNQTSCAACHVKIDPPGFALENYDVIGGWRTHYRNSSTKQDEIPVDAHHEMASGEEFSDIEQFKAIVSRRPKQIARNFVHQLVTYGTGATVSFRDRAAVEQILHDTEAKEFGVRQLIHAVVESPVFLSK